MDPDNTVDFTAADQDNDYKIAEWEACRHFYPDHPSSCQEIWSNGNDIADETFVYNWYQMDTDHDEIVSFEDMWNWTRDADYGRY